jgi:hypothetical protein
MRRLTAAIFAAAVALGGCFVTARGQVDIDHAEGTNLLVNTTPTMVLSNAVGSVVSVGLFNTSAVDCTAWHTLSNAPAASDPGYPLAGHGGHVIISEGLRLKQRWYVASPSNSAAITAIREHQ